MHCAQNVLRVPSNDFVPWAIVLAGGDGVRLQAFTRTMFGDDRPKQYLPLVGERSLLRQTLDRISRLVEGEHTIVITQQRHERYIGPEALGVATVLFQPENKNTALGILFPVHWLHARDPNATVVIVPSDHFVLEEERFMAHIGEVVRFVDGHPQWLVLVGARATSPDSGYGWIEPGAQLHEDGESSIFCVSRFREKPRPQVASQLFARGWLWNTFVIVAKASALVAAGEALLPDVHARLVTAAKFFGSRREQWAVEQAYRSAPSYDFSRAVLERSPRVAVSRPPDLTWSDLGTPERLLTLLRALRIKPSWHSRTCASAAPATCSGRGLEAARP